MPRRNQIIHTIVFLHKYSFSLPRYDFLPIWVCYTVPIASGASAIAAVVVDSQFAQAIYCIYMHRFELGDLYSLLRLFELCVIRSASYTITIFLCTLYGKIPSPINIVGKQPETKKPRENNRENLFETSAH